MNFLITGAARGIGRGMTTSLVRAGHRVFLLDAQAGELRHTLSMLASSAAAAPAERASEEPRYGSALCDLRRREEIGRAVEAAGEFFGGRLDVLVNNAAKTPNTWADGKSAEEVDEAEWDDFVAVNLTAAFLLTRACLPLLKRREGSGGRPGCVVNIGSTRAHMSEPDSEGYAATKAGLVGLTHSMAVSLGERHGIRVNAVSPGWIHVEDECREADERGRKWEEGLRHEDHGWHPAGRVGRAEDVLKAVLYCADADFVTGQELIVDGGVGRKMVYPE